MVVDMGEETSKRRGRDGDLMGAGCNVKNNQDSNGAQHEGILMNSSISVFLLLQISKFLRKYTHLGKYNYPRGRKDAQEVQSSSIEFSV